MGLKYQTYSNSVIEDPNENCTLFEEAYLANHPYEDPNHPTPAEQLAMKRTFASQMAGPVKGWVAQYATEEFTNSPHKVLNVLKPQSF